MSFFDSLAQEARIAAMSVMDYVSGTGLRLGVTGLSRAGKTVFITSLVQNLIQHTNLPVLRVHAEGRLTGASLQPQPDDAIPRFALEEHLAALQGELRHWPESTRRISELRITIEFERKSGWRSGPATFTIDIIDYPGEWLLDLPLLSKTYEQWSRETLESARDLARAALAAPFLAFIEDLDPAAAASEGIARQSAELFTAYLKACREEKFALSTLPPGRFLMPGDLEGSPALTFAPLSIAEFTETADGSLHAMMERRYEAYKSHVVKPFFRDHFARLDRQVVLVDALSAINSGPAAMRDLETALGDILGAFRAGRSNLLSTLFRPKIDRILFCATKADHLHHTSHDRLEAILRQTVARAIAKAEHVGASVDVIALAAVRATREAAIKQKGSTLDAIIGTPEAGESVNREIFDGQTEVALFPGSLPLDPMEVFQGNGLAIPDGEADMRFIKFRPPSWTSKTPLPHIRLDRAMQFLFGDKLA